MNQKIYKYPLAIVDVQYVLMPFAATILTAQIQGGVLCLWAMVDADAPAEKRTIEIIGTGNPVQEANREYIATVQDFAYVWHVFEKVTL